MKTIIDIPNSANQEKAARSILEISKLFGNKRIMNKLSVYFRVSGKNKHAEEKFDLPDMAIPYLKIILTNMAQGKGLEINSLSENLSTQQAADLIGVSRPFLVKLLEEGKMPFQKVGKHRRVKLSDVQTYEKAQQAVRDQQLDFLAQQAQDLKLGY